MLPAINASSPTLQEQGTCSHCGKSDLLKKIKQCIDCQFVLYCDAKCQKADWKKHRPICRELKQQSDFWKRRRISSEPHPNWKFFPIGLVFSRLEKPPFNKKIEHDKVAIDLGCGNGWSVEWLLAKGWKVIALDYYQNQLNIAENTAKRSNNAEVVASKLERVRKDVLDYQFPVKADLIIVQDLLPYLDPLKLGLLLRRIHHALKPNGWIMGSFFSVFHGGLKLYGGWYVKDEDTVKKLISSSGFEIESCGYRRKGNIRKNSIDFSARKQDMNSAKDEK